MFFYILKNKQSPFESYAFHPHHIIEEKAEFEEFIKALKERNVKFIRHSSLVETHGG
jgi:hypothetical protein